MTLPNPWYIDANARHYPATQRLLAYMAMQGEQGVLHDTHLKISALSTPGAAVNFAPGGYAVNCTHTGGAFEDYLGKIGTQGSVSVNPTTSAGGREDLVILRAENPYVDGAGSWSEPADLLNGPYMHIRVVEGVAAGTNSVTAHNNTWSAIDLAKIIRPANTGIVSPGHIYDLRSLADPNQQRTKIPGTGVPPIAIPDPAVDVPCPAPVDLPPANTAYAHWPNNCTATFPVPARAKTLRLIVWVWTSEVRTGRASGQFRARVSYGSEHEYTTLTQFDARPISSTIPIVIHLAHNGEATIRPNWVGQQVTVRLEAQHDVSGSTGTLGATTRTRFNVLGFFRTSPS